MTGTSDDDDDPSSGPAFVLGTGKPLVDPITGRPLDPATGWPVAPGAGDDLRAELASTSGSTIGWILLGSLVAVGLASLLRVWFG